MEISALVAALNRRSGWEHSFSPAEIELLLEALVDSPDCERAFTTAMNAMRAEHEMAQNARWH